MALVDTNIINGLLAVIDGEYVFVVLYIIVFNGAPYTTMH